MTYFVLLANLHLYRRVKLDAKYMLTVSSPLPCSSFVGKLIYFHVVIGGGVPSVLQEVRVPLIDNSVCQEMFQTAGHQKRIINSFLCAGYANGQKDSCEVRIKEMVVAPEMKLERKSGKRSGRMAQ